MRGPISPSRVARAHGSSPKTATVTWTLASGVAVLSLGHEHPHLVATLQARRATSLARLQSVPHSAGRAPCRTRLCRQPPSPTLVFLLQFGRGGGRMRDQDRRANIHSVERTAPERYRHHHLRGRLSRPHDRDHRGRREPQISRWVLARRLQGFDQVAFRRHRRRRGRDHGGNRRRIAGARSRARAVCASFRRRNSWLKLRALCDARGLLLALDEVQCGVGRTGKFLACEHAGDPVPDVAALAKGLGGGFPLGACLATREAAKGMTLGTHGSTFGGNPLADGRRRSRARRRAGGRLSWSASRVLGAPAAPAPCRARGPLSGA